MESSPALVRSPGVRVRCAHFGSLAWRTRPRGIYRLDAAATTALLLHDRPRGNNIPPAAVTGLTEQEWRRATAGLRDQGLLVPAAEAPSAITPGDAREARQVLRDSTPRVPVLKPLWAHIQPFTRCNQHCVH